MTQLARIPARMVFALLAGSIALGSCNESGTIPNTVPPPPPSPPPAPPPSPSATDTVTRLGAWNVALPRPISTKYEGMAWGDDQHGWVISDRGEILGTVDGGATWTLQASGLGLLRSADAVNGSLAFVGSLAGTMYRTTNGGATWQNITANFTPTAIGFCGITHIGNRVHVVGRYSGAADHYMSNDGGNTWQYQNLSTLAGAMVDIAFLDDQVGFIGGQGLGGGAVGKATILKTTDGGLTWSQSFLDTTGDRYGWAWKLFPVSSTTIYAALATGSAKLRIAKSTDRGVTWEIKTVATVVPAAGEIQGLGFLDEKVGFVGGFFTGMYATTDGGDHFHPVPTVVGSRLINKFRRVGNTLFTAGTQGILRYDFPVPR